jgi:hypothetical protein
MRSEEMGTWVREPVNKKNKNKTFEDDYSFLATIALFRRTDATEGGLYSPPPPTI